MEVSIKNMVCPRCISSVSRIFSAASVGVKEVVLGKVTTTVTPDEVQAAGIRKALLAEGFEWIDDPSGRLSEEVRNLVVSLVQSGELDEMTETLSDYISRKLHRSYHSVSVTFSATQGITIEQFFITQKIEKIKEWLDYNEYTLSEMAFRLGYSSVAHLSSQFRKVTGMTPSAYRAAGGQRQPIGGL